jgi:DNA-directed RNA polymerase specialized sigma subunit
VGEEDLAHPQDVRQLVAEFRRLSADQLKQLLAGGAQPGSRPEAAEQLVEGTLWVVLQAAEAHKSETLPLEDLFQEGSTALVTVVHGLDRSRPLSPEQFLNRVRQAVGQVMDSLMVEEEEARLEDLRWAADAEKLFAAEAELRLNSASTPTDLQLAAQLSWPVARVAQLRRAVDEARSQHDVELMDIIGEIEGP